MPYSQAGYIVAFVPMRDGRPSGDWEVFADGFAGIDPIPNTGDAAATADGPGPGTRRRRCTSARASRAGSGRSTTGRPRRVRRRRSCRRWPRARRSRPTSGARTSRRTSSARRHSPPARRSTRPTASSCHQRDAKGDGARFPPLAATNWVSGNKQRLISVVVHGLSGEIEVEGRRYNDVMPAHGFLTDEQIAQVLTYLRQNFGNYGQGVLKDEVAAARTRGPWTPQSQGQPRPGAPQTPQTLDRRRRRLRRRRADLREDPWSPHAAPRSVLLAAMVVAAATAVGGSVARPSRCRGCDWRRCSGRPPAFEGQLGTFRSPLRLRRRIARPHRHRLAASSRGDPGRMAWADGRLAAAARHGADGSALGNPPRDATCSAACDSQVAPGQRIEGWLLVPADCHGCGRRRCSCRSTSPRPASVSASAPIATSRGS